MPPSNHRPFPHPVAVFTDRFIFTALTAKDVAAAGKTPYEHPDTKRLCTLFSLDDEMRYTSFAMDHGPLNLAFTFHACLKIHEQIEKASSKKPVCLYTTTEPKQKSNMTLIAALYALIVGKLPPWGAFKPVAHFEVMPFRDAGSGPMDYGLSIQDILYGVEKAISFGLLDLATFDPEQYQYYETVENGDLNILGPFIPFASPIETTWLSIVRSAAKTTASPGGGVTTITHSVAKARVVTHTLKCVLQVFESHNVGLVTRLNDELYDRRHFLDLGIEHVEMYFDDGTNPPDSIVREFIRLAEDTIEKQGKKVAVHCKAGLGRTGVLIGAYLIYKFQFTAQEAIGFMRLVRPGMVVGPQQQYMVLNQLKWAGWAARDQVIKEIAEASASQEGSNPLATPPMEVHAALPANEVCATSTPVGSTHRPIARGSTKLRPRRRSHSPTSNVGTPIPTAHRGGDAVGQPRKTPGRPAPSDVEDDVEIAVEQSTVPRVALHESTNEPHVHAPAQESEHNPSTVSSLSGGSMRGTKRAARGSIPGSGKAPRDSLPRVSLNVPPHGALSRSVSSASISSASESEPERPVKRRTASGYGSPLAKSGLSSPPPSREATPATEEQGELPAGPVSAVTSTTALIPGPSTPNGEDVVEDMLIDTPRSSTPKLRVANKLRRRVSPSSPAVVVGPSGPSTPGPSAAPPVETVPVTPTTGVLEHGAGAGVGGAQGSLRRTMPKKSFLPVRRGEAKTSASPSASASIGVTGIAPTPSPAGLAKPEPAHLKAAATPKRQRGGVPTTPKRGILTPPRITEMWGQISRMGSSSPAEKN
ncbi:hypothetical protein IAT38_005030 [Cryptococcus sp. DSM 104549]